MLHDRRF